MDKEDFDIMEVKAERQGWYKVTLYQFKKEKPEYPDYIQEWVEFVGENWDYRERKNSCYVCFIHSHEDDKSK